MVECDIRVPDKWPSYFQHPTMTPYEYFEEMVPLFCTTDVPFDLTGEHMQDHVQRFELSEKPRQLMVGGMRGRQMLLATPLLKWYLEHGGDHIYQVVEFTPHRCFRNFVTDGQLSDGQRLGDAHPDKAIIGNTKNGEDNRLPSPQQRHSNVPTEKNGFSYFYCKRRVLDDGVCTVPLDLELCPIKKESMDEEEQPMGVDETETQMEVDTPVVLDDNDRYLIHLLEYCYSDSRNL
jgi:hypothetical protein